MHGMVGEAKLQPNHRGDPSTNPDVSPKAVGVGPTVQEPGQTGQLVGGQPLMRTPSAQAKSSSGVSPVIAATKKLWRQYHLSSDQTHGMAEAVRRVFRTTQEPLPRGGPPLARQGWIFMVLLPPYRYIVLQARCRRDASGPRPRPERAQST
jgi:hypothetical protein